MDVDIDELRRDPSAITGLRITEIADHYDQIIRELDRPPIIIDHSLGGLAVQLLLDRGLGAAGGEPSQGGRANTEAVHYAFTDTLGEPEAAAVYERYAVPGSERTVYQVSFANFAPHAATRVDLKNEKRRPSHEPATSGLCVLRFRAVDKLAQDEHGVVTAEAEAVAQRDADG
jgi:hypothetical protein